MRYCYLVATISGCLLSAGAFAEQGNPENKTETRIEKKPISPQTEYQFSRTLRIGSIKLAQKGVPGEVIRTYEVSFKDGKLVSKKQVKEEAVASKPTIYLMSSEGVQASRHGLRFRASKVIDMVATGYSTGNRENGGYGSRSASGIRLGDGVVAVDPRVITLGTVLFVEGYGFAVAGDTGGAIKGNRIDLCYANYNRAQAVGRRKVKVHVLKGVR